MRVLSYMGWFGLGFMRETVLDGSSRQCPSLLYLSVLPFGGSQSPCSAELISTAYQPWNSVFLSQQISHSRLISQKKQPAEHDQYIHMYATSSVHRNHERCVLVCTAFARQIKEKR
jgi:hypothetical protein